MLKEDNDSAGGKPGDWLCLGLCVVSAFLPQQQSSPSAVLTALFCCFYDTPVHLPGSDYPPQRGGGWGERETEMKDDEWLIKVER